MALHPGRVRWPIVDRQALRGRLVAGSIEARVEHESVVDHWLLGRVAHLGQEVGELPPVY